MKVSENWEEIIKAEHVDNKVDSSNQFITELSLELKTLRKKRKKFIYLNQSLNNLICKTSI